MTEPTRNENRWETDGDKLIAEADSPVPWRVEGHRSPGGGCRWLLDSPTVQRLQGWVTTGDGWWQRQTRDRIATDVVISEINRWM